MLSRKKSLLSEIFAVQIMGSPNFFSFFSEFMFQTLVQLKEFHYFCMFKEIYKVSIIKTIVRQMKNKICFLALLATVLMFSSCRSTKSFVYLQDMELGHGYPYDAKNEAVVHVNDRLDITVSSKSPELAIPFNANGGSFQVSSNGTTTAGVGEKKGYRVDVDGNIDFPILGKLHVEGMKVSEVTDMIRDRIVEGKYIKEPLVSLEFLNFKYSVLGAANNGTYSVEGDRITLLEAIARAGGVASNGRMNRVAVIREEDGQRVMYMHDLRSKNILQSPCYFLQQNDIVYVEPRYRKRDTEDNVWKYFSVVTSIASVICSLIWALK